MQVLNFSGVNHVILESQFEALIVNGVVIADGMPENKQPRREQRGILKQSDLMVRVQSFVFFPLIFHIPANHIFITMLTYSACEVSISPEFTSPQYLFHFWTPFEDFTRRDTFYQCNYFRDAVCRD